MPNYIARTTFEAPTGNPADRLVYSWGLSTIGGAPSVILDTFRVQLEASWVETLPTPANPLKNHLQAGFPMLFHELFAAEGGPALAVLDVINGPATNGAGSPGPTEVQLVVSRMTASARGPIATGRLYYGPLGAQSTRVAATNLMQTVVQHAKSFHNRLVTNAITPVVIAKAGTVLAAGKPIVGYKVDQLYDTQRRRGQENPAAGTSILVLV